MRVAYFSESLAPTISDGVTRTLTQLVRTLDHEGVEYRIFSPIDPGPSVAWRDRVRRVRSVPFLPYSYYRVGLPYLQGILRELERFRPDVVHAVNPTPLGIFGVDYARRRGIPAVSSYHTRFVSYLPYYRLRGFEDLAWSYLAWFYNRCQMTYAPSNSARSELHDRGIRDVELWQRGIDRSRFSPQFRSEELRARTGDPALPLLLFVGRLVREKDLADLVDTANCLKARRQPFRLVFVGDGPMRNELAQRLPEAHFAGYQEGAELAAWYASADLFVFPSTTETFGNVILEAFASGVPAVAVRAGGPADIVVPGENGLLASPHDAEDLANKIEVMLRNRSVAAQLREGALRSADRYDWSTINRRLIESYRRQIGRGVAQRTPLRISMRPTGATP